MTREKIDLRLVRQAGESVDQIISSAFSDPGTSLMLPVCTAGAASSFTSPPSSIVWEADGWHLLHRSEGWRFYLNGEAQAAGSTARIEAGDVLEVGLRRYVIEIADVPPSLPEHAPAAASAMFPSGAEEGLLSGENLFDIVPTIASVDLASEVSSLLLAGALPVGEDGVLPGEQGESVLQALNRDYFRALIDPELKGEAYLPVAQFSSSVGAAVEQDESPFAIGMTLEELTAGVMDIDTVMERLGPPEADQNQETRQEDILWLFAPEQMQPSANTSPPRLTRHDHHIMGIDSAHSFHPKTSRSEKQT